MLTLALVAGIVLSVAPPASAACDTLSAVRIGEGVTLFVGQRAAEGAVDAPAAVVDGCGTGDPRLDATVVTSTKGHWDTGPGPGFVGLPFDHREATWLVQLGRPVNGSVLDLQLAPMATEVSGDSSRVDRASNGRRHAVASLDEWTFLVVEQGAGNLLLRHLTSNGSTQEIDWLDTVVLDPTWPDDAVLVGADGVTGDEAFFARGGDALHVTRHPQGAAPSLPLAAGMRAAGFYLDGGPAAFVHDGSRLTLHRLVGGAWREEASIDCPEGDGLAAAAGGKRRQRAVAFVRDGRIIHGRAHEAGTWEARELDLDRLEAPSPAPSRDPDVETWDEPPPSRSRTPRLVGLGLLWLAGAAAVVALGLRWRRIAR